MNDAPSKTSDNTIYDIAIIGGGINGAGIARDAAGRGQKTLLLEAGDLAQATSSASTKLIHGGLRYLEHYEFRLVRKALKERETLLKIAPHIIWPLEFILPHNENLRPKWMIRAGLWLYDHMAARKHLPGSRQIKLDESNKYGEPLASDLIAGFSYSDCWVEDSRLVVLNALDAAERGAEIKLHEPCESLCVNDRGHWVIITSQGKYEARKLVNATGPWVNRLLEDSGLGGRLGTPESVRLVKGSHIIVPRMYEGEHSYILQLNDNRIVFVIPYEEKYSLIGTTDKDYEGNIYDVTISDDEVTYLCDAVSRNFQQTLAPGDVIWSYSGVRPLLDEGRGDASSTTRDYKLVKSFIDGAPILNIYGGKITTYRTLAEAALKDLGYEASWTHKDPLPGGDIENADFERFYKSLSQKYNMFDKDVVRRLARAYGTRAERVLKDPGAHLGDGVYEGEIRYLIETEMARDMEDILFRRSKLGLHISEKTQTAIKDYINDR